MSNDRIGFDVMIGDTIRVEIRVGSRSHIKRVRVRFTQEIEGPRRGTAHIETTGEVIDYRVGGAGRMNTAEFYIATAAAAAPGEYSLDSLEVLTASDRWLPVEDHPPIYLHVHPEPHDDTPTYGGMDFFDVPRGYSPPA